MERHSGVVGQCSIIARRRLARLQTIFTWLVLLNLTVPQTIRSEAFIKVTRFSVPSSVLVGQPVRLTCSYELSGETLHAMKLFKDDKEFYRYTPAQRREDQKMAFPVAGVLVNLAQSNEREVMLRPVNRSTAGLFKCQVSVEDTFKSISAEKRLEVRDRLEGGTGWQAANTGGSQAANKQQQQRDTATVQHKQQRQRGSYLTSMPAQQGYQQQQQQSAAAAATTHSSSSSAPTGTRHRGDQPLITIIQLVVCITMALITMRRQVGAAITQTTTMTTTTAAGLRRRAPRLPDEFCRQPAANRQLVH